MTNQNELDKLMGELDKMSSGAEFVAKFTPNCRVVNLDDAQPLITKAFTLGQESTEKECQEVLKQMNDAYNQLKDNDKMKSNK